MRMLVGVEAPLGKELVKALLPELRSRDHGRRAVDLAADCQWASPRITMR